MNIKQELINRYIYLYQNASFILAPFIRKISEKQRQEYNKIYEGIQDTDLKQMLIEQLSNKEYEFYLNECDDILYLLEDFLFTDKEMTETKLYKMIESNKRDSNYLRMIKEKLEFANKSHISLTIENILEKIGLFLDNQLGNNKNKKRKLKVLDEYYRLYRYRNENRIIFSGREISIIDVGISIGIPMKKIKPKREKKDVGTKKNLFICEINSLPKNDYNNSIFTEGEKQQAYLILHDELPWNLEINCNSSEDLDIHNETKCCNQNFYISESKIFIGPNNKFYQICPICGYIVEIPNEILTPGIIERIKRHGQIDDLYDKLCSYSKYQNMLYHMNSGDKQKFLRFINKRQ